MDHQVTLARKRQILPVIAGLGLAMLAAHSARNVGTGPAWFALTGLGFLLGALAIGLAQTLRLKSTGFETFRDSDWRHFEKLIELTPEQLSKLQSLTRRPHQKPDALAWIEAQWALPPQMNEALLRFFVTSGWASGGHSPHSQDPEWRWQISEGHGQ